MFPARVMVACEHGLWITSAGLPTRWALVANNEWFWWGEALERHPGIVVTPRKGEIVSTAARAPEPMRTYDQTLVIGQILGLLITGQREARWGVEPVFDQQTKSYLDSILLQVGLQKYVLSVQPIEPITASEEEVA